MHIPDSFIPIGQALVYWAVALVFIALSLRWARNEMNEEKIPLVAVLAQDDHGLHGFLALGLSRDADHDRLTDAGMSADHVLHLDRVDLVAAKLDQ